MNRVATLVAAAAGVLAAVTLVPDVGFAGGGHGGHGGGHGGHGGHAWHGGHGGHGGGHHWRGWGWGWGPGIGIGRGYYGGRCWSDYYGWVPCRRLYGWY